MSASTRIHNGVACVFPFSRERGYLGPWAQYREDFPKQPGKGGALCNSQQYTNTRNIGYMYDFPRDGGGRDGAQVIAWE